VTYFLEAGRGFVSGNSVHAGIAFGAAAGLGVLFTIWALRGLKDAETSGA
jgi:hypothetical protein